MHEILLFVIDIQLIFTVIKTKAKSTIIFIWYNWYGVSKAQGHKIFDKYHLIAFFQQDDTCLESKKTLKIVSICPTNENAFKERSEKKNCNILSTCAGESLFYHCVMFDGMLIEVCALRTPITGFWIAIVHTGIFNTILHVLSKPSSVYQ